MSATAVRPGALEQSVGIGFRALYAATALLALVWLASNIREVPPDRRAVVLRLGRIVRVAEPGLLLAWPDPIERVQLLPGADGRTSQTVAPLLRAAGLDDDFTDASGTPRHGDAGSYLTGDGSVVLLDATMTWHVADPVAYYLSAVHVPPALDRLFRASAIGVIAGRNLDDLLVARPDRALAAGQDLTALRQAVRDDLLHAINQRLQALAQGGDALGVEIDRIDLTAWLPPAAKLAFDSVLTATQMADQGIAAARTEAERTRQSGERERTRLLDAAHAAAAERVSLARTQAAPVAALARAFTPDTRSALMQLAFRDRIAALMQQAGSVTAIDARSGARVIIPGSKP